MSKEQSKSPLPGFTDGIHKIIDNAIKSNDLDFFYRLYLTRMAELSLTGQGKEFIECRPFSLTDDWWQENAKRVHKYSFVNYNFRGRFKLEYIVNKLTGNRKADKEIIFAGNSCWFCLSYWAIVYIQSSY